MCPSLIEIGSKTAEKNSAQTYRQTDRQTNRQTDHDTSSVTIGRIYVGSTAMRPNNNRHVCVGSNAYVSVHSFIGSRPSDHYFRSVCLFVCAEFFSAVFDPISIKLGHMLYVWVYSCVL